MGQYFLSATLELNLLTHKMSFFWCVVTLFSFFGFIRSGSKCPKPSRNWHLPGWVWASVWAIHTRQGAWKGMGREPWKTRGRNWRSEWEVHEWGVNILWGAQCIFSAQRHWLQKGKDRCDQGRGEKVCNGTFEKWSWKGKTYFRVRNTCLPPQPKLFGPLTLKISSIRANEAFFARYRLSRGSVPASVNSVNANKVTPVKNQGRCGSCSAFSAASLLETCMLIGGDSVDKAKLDLSEQDLMDCAYDNKYT